MFKSTAFMIVASCLISCALADTGKFLTENLRTRSAIAGVMSDIYARPLFRFKPLTFRVEAIAGTDLSDERGLGGFLAGLHFDAPFGFRAFLGAGAYVESQAKPTQALVFCVGKGF